VLFLRPKIETTLPFALTSDINPILADPLALGTSTGPFPGLSVCIPFNNADYQLLIRSGNHLTLQLPSPSFTTQPVARVLRDSQTIRSLGYTNDKGGNPSVVTIAIDTAAATPWSVNITNLSSAWEDSTFGEVMHFVGTVSADSNTPMQLTDTQMIWGKSLQTIVDAISFFQIFGPMSPLKVSMTNDWTYRAGGQIDLDVDGGERSGHHEYDQQHQHHVDEGRDVDLVQFRQIVIAVIETNTHRTPTQLVAHKSS